MKKMFKRFFAVLCCAFALVSVFVLASCGATKAKIGVLVSDKSTPEALGFINYYQNYIEKQYDV
jgi:glycine betaine/choline ABC-type transport system substrate-binding protein